MSLLDPPPLSPTAMGQRLREIGFLQDPQFRKWSTAVAKMRNGVRNAKLVMIGDSTTAGSGSTGTAGYLSGGRATCPGVKLAKRLRDSGLPAYASGAYGPPAGLTNAQYKAWDSRIAGTGWGPQGSPLGGSWLLPMVETTAANSFSFTPSESINTFEIVYSTATNSRVFSYAVDGGAATNVEANTGTSSLATVTVNAGSVGAHTLTIAKVSGATNYIWGIRAYDSSNKCVEVMPWGISSRRAQDGIASTNPYDALPALQYFAPDLTIINLCINEWVQAGDVATYKTNLATVIAAAQVSGDVIVQTGVPTQATTTALAVQVPYVDAAIATAIAMGAAVDDTWRKFQSRERDSSIYTDTTHPNGAGYELMCANASRIALL